MALLVLGDVLHALAEPGEQVAVLEVAGDEVLAGLGERGLDDDVVERDRLGELGNRAVAPQLVGHALEPVEDLAKPQVSCGRIASRASPAVPPMPTTSSMKRLKKIAWRASSTCCVARKYFCSSSGAASMYGERPSVTASSPQKKSE